VPVPAAEPEAAPEAAPVEAADEPEETPAPPAAAPKPARPAKVAAAPAAPPRKQGVPEIAADSPARMLNPPISIQRTEFELSGVGDAVQVREVSQNAKDNVGAGYSALVSGAYDMSLGFYDRALRDEPTSVLALLGRGAALQKMRRLDEAQAAYNRVLAIDPDNREALSNLTVILDENAPAEAIAKLLVMEKDYPTFSPIKAQLGLAYAKQGSMNAALDYLRRATALSPESVMYQYNMALVLDHLSLSDQAVVAYERVLANLASGRSAPELSSTDIERRVRYLRAR
jgi:tetratricopeptide (TPR) repeat protein